MNEPLKRFRPSTGMPRRRLNNSGIETITIRIPTDKQGMAGRICPSKDCGRYFKLKPGTGSPGESQHCRCPYCGFLGDADSFITPDQMAYMEAAAKTFASELIYRAMKKAEFKARPQGPFGIGLSMKVTGRPDRFTHVYREKDLETEVVCDGCSLVYAIYGAFAFCPDCGSHNSLTILSKNLELQEKMLARAEAHLPQDNDLAELMIGNVLGNVVAAFDGFGREVCRVASVRTKNPKEAQGTTFQNLEGARKRLLSSFGFDFAITIPTSDWQFACQCAQKRHLLAHKMGIVDKDYIAATKDPAAVAGRKIRIGAAEVKRFIDITKKLGMELIRGLSVAKAASKNESTAKPAS